MQMINAILIQNTQEKYVWDIMITKLDVCEWATIGYNINWLRGLEFWILWFVVIDESLFKCQMKNILDDFRLYKPTSICFTQHKH